MRKLVYALYLLVLIDENPQTFVGNWHTPLQYVDLLLFQNSPLKLPFFFFLQIGVLIAVSSTPAAKRGRAAPMDRALWLGVAAVLAFTVYGAIQGGKPWMAGWQLYNLINATLFAKLLLATMRTPAHFETLGKVIMAAALFRAGIAIVFWYFFVHDQPWPKGPPPYMTTHDDTVLFVVGIMLASANALVRRTSRSVRFALVSAVVILIAIQLNNRRLAWASLSFALVLVYLLLPPGRVRKRVNWALLGLSPAIAAYVAIGWGRPEKIFKPLASFSTMSTQEDSSTLARNAENAGLLATLMRGGWVTGTGWGQEYVEVDNRYSIDGLYKEWRYVPHNSVLGVLAFSGVLGFAGLWLSFPVSAYLNARTWRRSQNDIERIAALTALTEVVVCTNQMFGDMGLQSQTTLFVMASGFAAAGRLSVTSGAWPDKGKPRVVDAPPSIPPAPEVA